MITNSDLFNALIAPHSSAGPSLGHNSKELQARVTNIIYDCVPEYFCDENDNDEKFRKELNAFIYKYCANIVGMWNRGTGVSEFWNQYKEWLDKSLILPTREAKKRSLSIAAPQVGRPEKPFSECCEKSKKRKVEKLVNGILKEEIVFAAKYSLNKSGKEGERTTAFLISEATKTPQSALEIKKAWKNKEVITKMDSSSALGTCSSSNICNM